mgnify:CR=1 FL=1
MNINDQFPSKYLKASDLKGREVTVTIARIEMEALAQGEKPKPVLYFVGKEKGVVMNKTNAMNLAAGYGPETEDWLNMPVVLFPVWTDFQGKSVEAIRIRPAPRQPVQRQPASADPRPTPPVQTATEDNFDDAVPF